MTDYEHLNVESRVLLGKYLGGRVTSDSLPSEVTTLLVANFLREISDTLARIDEKLSGIEMDLRPRP